MFSLNLVPRNDFKNYLIILIYVLLYFSLRVSCSPYLDWDEAEQFILAQNFDFGDAHQPPLYSWIIKSLSLIFGFSSTLIISVRYLCLFVFLFFLYKSVRFFFDEEDSLLYLNSTLALVLTYGYVINFKLTHSVLVFACASFCFYSFLRLYKQRKSWNNYTLFALSVALGMLSKFNFIFLIASLVCSCLVLKQGRSILFSIKSFVSIFIVFLIISPYYLWLMTKINETSLYLNSRGLTHTETYNYFFEFFSLLFSAISPVLFYLLFFIISCFCLREKASDLLKLKLDKCLLYISCFSYLITVLLFLLNKATKLAGGWLAVSHFITTLVIFSFSVHLYSKTTKQRLQYLFLGVNIVFFLIKISWICVPDLYSKVHRINIPYQLFYKNITDGNLNFKIKICDDQIVTANLNNLDASLNLETINKRKKIIDKVKANKNLKILIVLNRLNHNKKFIDKLEDFMKLKKISYQSKGLAEKYLHSNKKTHSLIVYEIN